MKQTHVCLYSAIVLGIMISSAKDVGMYEMLSLKVHPGVNMPEWSPWAVARSLHRANIDTTLLNSSSQMPGHGMMIGVLLG